MTASPLWSSPACRAARPVSGPHRQELQPTARPRPNCRRLPWDSCGGALPPAAATAAAAAAVAEIEGNLFRQEGEYWTVVFDGSVVRLKDTKGLRYLARLLAHMGREFHAVDLEAAEAQAAPAAPLGSRASGGEPELARAIRPPA